MGSVAKSVGSTLGIGPDDSPKVQAENGNSALEQLLRQGKASSKGIGSLTDYANGKITSGQAFANDLGDSDSNMARNYALATDPLTGSKFATEQVNNNSILGGLYGSGPDSQLSQAEDKNNYLSSHGYSLSKEDNDALGQVSGNIARQYGSQEAGLAQALADHGLSAAPSGAAAINFTGLAGNKNEALANAQTQIAQQRIQNNQNALAQNQSFLSNLGNGASNAINQQYQRQLAGSQNQMAGVQAAAGTQNQSNAQANSANLGAANFNAANETKNIGDAFGAGLMSSGYAAGAYPGKAAFSNKSPLGG